MENQFHHHLIVAITTEGYSDLVMDAARSAGAAGGTILRARGTGREKDQKFFGMSLASEKEAILIACKGDDRDASMQAIIDSTGRSSEAHTICFSLPIDQIAGMKLLEDK